MVVIIVFINTYIALTPYNLLSIGVSEVTFEFKLIAFISSLPYNVIILFISRYGTEYVLT